MDTLNSEKNPTNGELMMNPIRICVLLSCIFAVIAIAPALGSLGTTVPSIAANVTAGDKFSEEITIYSGNDSGPMDLTASVCGIIQAPDGTTKAVALSDDMYQYSAAQFFKISPDEFHLEPGTTKQITFEGTIPQNAGEGGRYAIIRIQSAPLGSGTVGVALAIEIPVKLGIKGTNFIRTGEITSLEVAKPLSRKEQNISLEIKNTGNYHYKAKAELSIKDDSGYVLASASLPMGDFNIIPLALRSVNLTLIPKKELKPGIYHLEANVIRSDGGLLASKEENLTVW